MKVFTFFYNRYNDATTSKALYDNDIEHNVLIHTHCDYEKFVNGKTIYGNPVITNNNKGLAYQRNTALNMMNIGEWAVFLCDDFKQIKSVPMELLKSKTQKIDINFNNQSQYRLKKKDAISLKKMFSYFPQLIEVAEKNRIHLIGFGLHDNPLNLKNRYTTRGLADGRFWLVKKSTYDFDIRAQLIDDVAWTAENLIRHNKVLVLNWIVPEFRRYTKGGFGSTEERKQLRRKECLYLAYKYNPLVRIANKPKWDYGTHIKIFGSKNNIEQARKKLLI
ncbi:MAG: hypothetical protein FJY17_02070 [Bacteroidetes bacterium]|nr:hypothetical protein [Bacteroidota bacterium]